MRKPNPNLNMKTLLTLVAALSTAGTVLADSMSDHNILVLKNRDGVAIQGYDPVAYFTEHKAVKGSSKFTSEYQSAKYDFASADHKELFDANPAKYVPAYGGYCGYAASIGKVRPADPLIWSIVDGRLIVQNTKGAAELWEKDVAGNKAKADKYWPLLVKAKAGKKNPVDGLFSKSVLDLKAVK
jgi:YHS domain-containing protein